LKSSVQRSNANRSVAVGCSKHLVAARIKRTKHRLLFSPPGTQRLFCGSTTQSREDPLFAQRHGTETKEPIDRSGTAEPCGCPDSELGRRPRNISAADSRCGGALIKRAGWCRSANARRALSAHTVGIDGGLFASLRILHVHKIRHGARAPLVEVRRPYISRGGRDALHRSRTVATVTNVPLHRDRRARDGDRSASGSDHKDSRASFWKVLP